VERNLFVWTDVLFDNENLFKVLEDHPFERFIEDALIEECNFIPKETFGIADSGMAGIEVQICYE